MLYPQQPTTHVKVNSIERLEGALVLIIGGLRSSYIYTELIPEKTDGTKIETHEYDNFSMIFDKSACVLNVSSPHPYNEVGRSVQSTGY